MERFDTFHPSGADGSSGFVPHRRERPSLEEARGSLRAFHDAIATRRSVRSFSADPVPLDLLLQAIACANTAPSGANMQPWQFVVVGDRERKRKIREAAEAEERENYGRRMTDEWLAALRPLGTDWHKEFLEIAPWLIVVFRVDWRSGEGGHPVKHYYVHESVGIACGFLLAALHQAGLATLTHTPSPMGFLQAILERGPNEKSYLLIPVGYPAHDCRVPDLRKLPPEAVTTVHAD